MDEVAKNTKTLAEQISAIIGVKKDTLVISVKQEADWMAERIAKALEAEDNRIVNYMDFNEFYNRTNFQDVIRDIVEGPWQNFVFVADKTLHYDNRFFDVSHCIGGFVDGKKNVKMADKIEQALKDKKTLWVSLENNQKEWLGHFNYVLSAY